MLVSACAVPAAKDDVSSTADPAPSAGARAAPAGVDMPYEATGTEPGWRLTLADGTLTLDAYYGETRVQAPVPTPERRAGALVYRATSSGHQVTVEIRDRYCTNAMSGKPFPDSVAVTLNGNGFDGCGGDPASLLTGEPWRVVSVAGEPVDAPRSPTMHFEADGTVTGTDGCNRYGGRYRITGIGLQVSDLAGTRMSCPGPGDELARRFHQALASVGLFRLEDGRTLVLEGDGGDTLTAER